MPESLQRFPLQLAVMAVLLTIGIGLWVQLPPLILLIRSLLAMISFLLLGQFLKTVWIWFLSPEYPPEAEIPTPETSTPELKQPLTEQSASVTGQSITPTQPPLPPSLNLTIKAPQALKEKSTAS